MLGEALSDHRPKGVTDQSADAGCFRWALADVDLADDGREPAAADPLGFHGENLKGITSRG